MGMCAAQPSGPQKPWEPGAGLSFLGSRQGLWAEVCIKVLWGRWLALFLHPLLIHSFSQTGTRPSYLGRLHRDTCQREPLPHLPSSRPQMLEVGPQAEAATCEVFWPHPPY